MACSSCGKRRGIVPRQQNLIQTNNTLQNRGTPTLIANDFTRKYYVGPDGVVQSVLSHISYGHRTYGDTLLVHKKDIDANAHLWVDELPMEYGEDINLED